jgi:hypothetical protein
VDFAIARFAVSRLPDFVIKPPTYLGAYVSVLLYLGAHVFVKPLFSIAFRRCLHLRWNEWLRGKTHTPSPWVRWAVQRAGSCVLRSSPLNSGVK